MPWRDPVTSMASRVATAESAKDSDFHALTLEEQTARLGRIAEYYSSLPDRDRHLPDPHGRSMAAPTSTHKPCSGLYRLSRRPMKNALIINAFQLYEGFSKGELNKTMAGVIQEELERRGYEVRTTNIEQGYVVEEEVEKHVWADVIVLQTPIHWFGAPWIYKKYADEVFTAGLLRKVLIENDGRVLGDPSKQYGTGGRMQGKKYMLSLTWNAPRAAFDDEEQYLFTGKSVDDVMIANTANYRFCGAEVLPSFSAFNVIKEPHIVEDIARLRDHLAQLFPIPVVNGSEDSPVVHAQPVAA
ncbi:NAD(P)H-dependent oxidoreductase [Pseudoxanthomonas putridarboris]|uniref:NAD(P)H-dependent oxidoreductase n=1 Tax=Pseudoxanthomonas putridarboris TaxID=752605 RepID=A0ABU9J2C0_9GAMM